MRLGVAFSGVLIFLRCGSIRCVRGILVMLVSLVFFCFGCCCLLWIFVEFVLVMGFGCFVFFMMVGVVWDLCFLLFFFS